MFVRVIVKIMGTFLCTTDCNLVNCYIAGFSCACVEKCRDDELCRDRERFEWAWWKGVYHSSYI